MDGINKRYSEKEGKEETRVVVGQLKQSLTRLLESVANIQDVIHAVVG